jgi:hypothetical protein
MAKQARLKATVPVRQRATPVELDEQLELLTYSCQHYMKES